MSATFAPLALPAAPRTRLQVRVVAADALSPVALHSLYPAGALTPARTRRLASGPLIVVLGGGRVVAAGAYRLTTNELIVSDIGIDAATPSAVDEVMGALIEWCERACLEASCLRVVLIAPPAKTTGDLVKSGYSFIDEGCAGAWVEKRF